MSDTIEKDGRTYIEISYLAGANATAKRLNEWLAHATEFTFGGKPPNMQCRTDDLPIQIVARDQRDGTRMWAIKQGGNCLRRDGDWELEAQPSSRSDEFIAQTRFYTIEEARAHLDAAMQESAGRQG